MLGTIGLLLVLGASGLGQEPRVQPSPALPATVLGPQLIVWSQAQKPQPVPQPLPSSGPDQQPEQQQPGQTVNAPAQQPLPATQTFAGTIMKDGTKYILKDSSGTTYQLDDQDNAKQYEGKQVKILGSLDAKSNTVHVVSIQLSS